MSDDIPGVEPLTTDPPALDARRVAAIATECFGKRGTAVELGGERDRNFRIDTEGGDRFVLKVYNRTDKEGAIDFRTQAIRHIHDTNPDLPVMEVVPTVDGEPWASVTVDDETHLAQLFTFVPGRSASFENLADDALCAYGEKVARMGQALRGFFHPEANYDIVWDLRHTSALRSLLDHVADDRRRAVAETVIDRFDERVEPIFGNLRAQVIHNDLGPDNVLLDEGDRVSGITDFGDLTHTALVCDLAVVLANVLNRHDDPLAAVQSVIRGYVSVTPLEAEEIRLLPDLVSARLAARGLMHAWQHEKYAHNAADEDGLWETLLALEGTDLDALRRLLRTAAQGSAVPYSRAETSELLARRRRVLGSARLSYRDPVHFVAGDGVWLFDQSGRRYLDAYNNVQVVGHANREVTAAIETQARKLTTNTRYLHESTVVLAERLLATLPDELDRIILVNSGSEANEVAWRLATTRTGRRGGIVADHAYHGITDTTAALSPENWPNDHRPSHIETVAPPVDSEYHGIDSSDAAATMTDALDALGERGSDVAAFMFDPLFASAGILPPEPTKLRRMVEQVHEAGGLVIADEVQAGFGRTGANMWGFQATDVVPDIVTMGKPMGNGHPVAAVATRSEIASTLRERTGLFSTFGGNPVSSVAALAVLDVIEDEELLAHTVDVGDYLQEGLTQLAAKYDSIGEIRRSGLMVGIELVGDRETWAPATDEAAAVVDRLRQRRVLVGATGKAGNVLKIRPPLVFESDHADHLVAALDDVLAGLE